jgi:hypothetical protein
MHYVGQAELQALLAIGLPHLGDTDTTIDTNIRNHLLSNTVSYTRIKELITMIPISIISPFLSLCYHSSPATW